MGNSIWLFGIALESDSFIDCKHDDLPNEKMGTSHIYVKKPEGKIGVSHMTFSIKIEQSNPAREGELLWMQEIHPQVTKQYK